MSMIKTQATIRAATRAELLRHQEQQLCVMMGQAWYFAAQKAVDEGASSSEIDIAKVHAQMWHHRAHKAQSMREAHQKETS